MTSYTKKLYEISPAAAKQIHRQQYRDYRYGKHVTLAQFTPEANALPFGKRETPPILPAYECSSPTFGKPKQVVRAADSFTARKQYAAHHQIAVTDVMARRFENPKGWREADGVTLPPVDAWAQR